jgi:hypothetical protein
MLTNHEQQQTTNISSRSCVVYPQADYPYGPPNNDPITVTVPGESFQTLFEKIRTDNEGSHDQWKPFEHYKRLFNFAGPSLFPWSTRSQTDIGHWVGQMSTDVVVGRLGGASFTNFGDRTLYEDRPDGGFVPAPDGLSLMLDRAVAAAIPTIKSKMSLLNSIIELKDFGSLPRTLANVGRLADKIGRGLRVLVPSVRLGGRLQKANEVIRNRKRAARLATDYERSIRASFPASLGRTLAEYLQAAADGYLQLEFNIEPLLSDISAYWALLSDTHSRINKLLLRQGQLQTSHFNMKFMPSYLLKADDESTFSIGDPYNFQANAFGTLVYGSHVLGFKHLRQYAVSMAHFHSEIEYTFTFSRFQNQYTGLLSVLDSLGVNLNPSIIWNAIPWSFVVDWLFDVSRFLSQFKVLNMEPTVNITRCLWSWKVERTLRSKFYSYQSEAYCPPVPPRPLVDGTESVYRRDLYQPTLASLTTSGLTSKEVSLGVALAITQAKRLKLRSTSKSLTGAAVVSNNSQRKRP